MTTYNAIKKLYKQLPYVVFKHYKDHYLIPHKPIRPSPNKIQIYIEAHAESKNLYNGNLSSTYSTMESFVPLGKQKIQLGKAKFQTNFHIYQKQLHIYQQKYLKPLKIKSTSALKLFRKQIRQQGLKRLNITNKNTRVSQFGCKKLTQMWHSLTQDQRKSYYDKQHIYKVANNQIIANFIQNHQIPLIKKRIPAISRYAARFLHQTKQLDGKSKLTKQFMLKYAKLSQQQKEQYKNEAKSLQMQSRVKYQNFLKRWGLAKPQLERIIQVSMKYRQFRKNIYHKNLKTKEEDESDDQEFLNIIE